MTRATAKLIVANCGTLIATKMYDEPGSVRIYREDRRVATLALVQAIETLLSAKPKRRKR